MALNRLKSAACVVLRLIGLIGCLVRVAVGALHRHSQRIVMQTQRNHRPGKISENRVSDEIVHVSDLYTTLATLAGAEDKIPTDRPVDGLDQCVFLFGEEQSKREGFVYFIKETLRAVKWQDWKCHYYWEPEVNQGSGGKLESPLLFHLKQDPKEETNVIIENTWAMGEIMKLTNTFKESLKEHPPIAPGTPDPD